MMRGKNVVMFNGHGMIRPNHADISHLSSGSTVVQAGEDILPTTTNSIPGYDTREDHMGYGLPPFNTTEVPPVNLMWHYSCNSGLQPGFARVLWPFLMEGWPPLANQGFVGYNRWVLVDKCSFISYRVYLHLLQHDETVSETVRRLVEEANNEELPDFIVDDPDNPSARRLQLSDISVY